ncbi:sugar ABC transporter ATP-binding protein [Kribbella turkmenica]|uniref:Sugar ABC transporter ATP-binding protein n=1 Tax=Kribbella turkmenica TaxID=2530375 RepID=A0A4R4W6C0_9ACTN|nr:sugar ABC transporter ATP-binding protein [Kribbella turkmenica]TDD13511.1 sugar ABC transporter ATP-binding protein [Kribbella turkmenica]
MAAAPPLLEARGIRKAFPGVLALDDVSFRLGPGEVHALVGENGAGKSTLIKVLTGVYQPDRGELRLGRKQVAFATPLQAQRAGISTIYQEVNLVPQRSVAHNLLLGREPRTRLGVIDLAGLYDAATRTLSQYGIRVDVRRPLRSLGMGAQQMVALARAVSTEARVVIMDEPTSALEPREVDTLFGVIDRLRGQGMAVVYVSHRMEELYRICDRVTVLRDGRLAHTGPLAELDRLKLIAVMLGRDVAEVRERGTTTFSGDHEVRGGPLVEAKGLSRRNLLNDVSVTVRPGEVVGLGGLLGAGRSETAKAIAGAFPVDAGTVLVAGRQAGRATPAARIRAGVSLLPEDRKAEGIVPALSVRDNIALAALPRLSSAGVVSEAKIDRIVDTFVRRLRIKVTSPHQKVSELSGGNQQKVLLARWLATGPKVLLLDEPTRGIDVGAKAEVQALIEELAAEGLGVLLISSDLEELVEGADRVVVLRDGAVVGELAGGQVTESAIITAIAAGGGDD